MAQPAGSQSPRAEQFQSFAEFYPFYLSEHSHPVNRWLHFVGSTGTLACVAALVTTLNPLYLLLAPVSGYGCAWIGHFFVEHNKPAAFSSPLWSFMGDWRMYATMLTGRLWTGSTQTA